MECKSVVLGSVGNIFVPALNLNCLRVSENRHAPFHVPVSIHISLLRINIDLWLFPMLYTIDNWIKSKDRVESAVIVGVLLARPLVRNVPKRWEVQSGRKSVPLKLNCLISRQASQWDINKLEDKEVVAHVMYDIVPSFSKVSEILVIFSYFFLQREWI